MSYGIKVSKPGYDATTASSKNLVYSSDFKTPKIYTLGDFSITTDANGNATSGVAHGLEYAPGFYVFRKGTTKANVMDGSTHANAFTPNNETFDVWWDYSQKLGCHTDTSAIYFKATSAAGSAGYDFRYYVLLDPSEETAASGEAGATYGLRTTQAGFDALTGKVYQSGIDSKYNTFSYHDGLVGSYNLTLPTAWASQFSDPDVEEGTYVDIIHNLSYPPFYLACVEINNQGSLELHEIPAAWFYTDVSTDFFWAVNSWCDDTRVRLSFWRRCKYYGYQFPNGFSEQTVTVKWIICEEPLNG